VRLLRSSLFINSVTFGIIAIGLVFWTVVVIWYFHDAFDRNPNDSCPPGQVWGGLGTPYCMPYHPVPTMTPNRTPPSGMPGR
jgi:hypothetical protein